MTPPEHLSAEMAAFWVDVQQAWDLDIHHVKILTLACEAWDRCAEARELQDAEGLTALTDRGGAKAHPAAAIEKDSRLAFARLIRELGLDVEEPAGNRPPRIGGAKH